MQEELGERQRRDVSPRADEGDLQKAARRGRPAEGSPRASPKKIEKLELPKEARAEVDRELNRLERAGRESMEAQVIRTYLEWVAELPWAKRSGR